MKPSTRKLLEEAALYGKRNSGYGYSTARLIREALANEDEEANRDDASYARQLIAEMLHGEAKAIDRAIVDIDDRVFIAMTDVEALVAG